MHQNKKKIIKAKNYINTKPKVPQVYGVTLCIVSHDFGIWIFIVEKIDSVKNRRQIVGGIFLKHLNKR